MMKAMSIRTPLPSFVAAILLLNCLCAGAAENGLKFQFGPGKVQPGYTQVLPTAVFSAEAGYGFEPGPWITGVERAKDNSLQAHFCTSKTPFFFSVDIGEGNFDITVVTGDAKGESTTTVKAESRRLMLESIHTAPGKFESRTFTVNVRTPHIAPGQEVKLKA